MTPPDEAMAWMALLATGRLGPARWTAEARGIALQAGWARTTARRGEVSLDEHHRAAIEARLDRLRPGWRSDAEAFVAAGVSPSPGAWNTLHGARRREQLPAHLPDTLNRRTLAAATRDHAKARVSDALDLPNTAITHDNLLRLRPHPGLVLARAETRTTGADIAALCGEVCVTDRAVRLGTRLTGDPPDALLLIENLGVYVDIPLPGGWCAAHVPGWNTRMVAPLRDAWPGVPALLFGDLDPNGLAIARALRDAWPGLVWFVPDFARDYLDRARPAVWPDVVGDAPPVVRTLMERGLWLEQELFVLDPRLGAELRAAVRRG